MSKIQKTSKERNMSIFDAMFNEQVPLNKREPEMKQSRQEKKRDRSWESASSHTKLAHSTPDEVDLGRTGRSIRSARCSDQGITNEGGSGRQIGASRNSVADKGLLDKISDSVSSKEATSEERKASKNIREVKQSEYRNAQSPRLGDEEVAAMSRKSASIASSCVDQRGRYIPPTGKMSIFDNADFERVKPTAGETMKKREASKDDSWQKVKKAHTVKDIEDKAFADLSGQNQESGYKNLHQNSVERIFESIVGNLNKNGK